MTSKYCKRTARFLTIAAALGWIAPVYGQTADGDRYRLEAGDDIEIKFHYNPELNERVIIRPDGRIAMPLIGDLQAAGMTPEDLSQTLEKKFADEVRTPKVVVQIRSYANRRIFVGGEVLHPGTFALVGQQTVLSALLEAGGLIRTSDRAQVTLIRRTADGPQARIVKLKAASGMSPEAASVAMQPYDVIVVNRSGIAKANQAVDQYIRSMSPALMTAGFNYLYNSGLGMVPIVP